MKEADLIYKIAALYFNENLTQQQIALRMGVSRIKVSRLLQQARVNKIVEITLHKPQQSFSEEEQQIAGKWKLMEVLLTPPDTGNTKELLSLLGQAAADYAMRVLSGTETVSLTWGSALSAFVESLPRLDYPGLRIVQMLGGLGSPEKEVHSSDLVRRLADKTGGRGRILSAPGIVSSPGVKKGLLEDPYIQETLAMAAAADIAFIGIGTASPDSILMSQGMILAEEALADLKAQGAVGDLCLRFFDKTGKMVVHPINDRIIGLTREQIGKIPRVVAVAGGKEKRKAVRGALKSGLVNVLITDYDTGMSLLEEE